MHCASCSAIIKKHLMKLEGMSQVEVNVATQKATLTFEAERVTPEHMNQVLLPLGYSLVLTPKSNPSSAPGDQAAGLTTEEAKTHFVLPLAGVFFVLMLWEIAARAYFSIPNFPFPMELWNIFSFIVATIVLFWIGRPFLLGVIRFMRFGAADMHTLIGIGTSVAYLYSSFIVLLPSLRASLRLPEETYFDVVIVVIGFVTLGKYLEARAKAKTGDALSALLHLQAKTALVLRDGQEVETALASVRPGDLIRVKPAGRIPVDGILTDGFSSVDESMLSGESMPVEKKVNAVVRAGTLNTTGTFVFRVTAVGETTVLARIIRMVEEAQGSRAPIQALVDRISAVFVPTVLGFAVLMACVWLIFGTPVYGFAQALSFALLAAVGILVIACPCALGLATPLSIIVGVGKGAREGILVRDASTLEQLSRAAVIVMDKTGTLTQGKPEVMEIEASAGHQEGEVIALAAALEKRSEHPLSEAFLELATRKNILIPSAEDFEATRGKGVAGSVAGAYYSLGSVAWAKERGFSVDDRELNQAASEGRVPLVLCSHDKVVGTFLVADQVRPAAREAVAELRNLGFHIVMLTGDHEGVAQYIGAQVGIKDIVAQASPEEKFAVIKRLQGEGKSVVMVGDGINDAPALAQAEVGIAMATGTDAAIESAGITLLHGDISKLVKAVRLSRMTLSGIKQNLFLAFAFNIIGIPLAGGVFYPLFGWFLSPAFAGLAMAFSSVTVVGNALRLKTKKL